MKPPWHLYCSALTLLEVLVVNFILYIVQKKSIRNKLDSNPEIIKIVDYNLTVIYTK